MLSFTNPVQDIPKLTAEKRILVFLLFQLISLVGSKVSHVAIGFWIYEQTQSVLNFSIILFLSFLPGVIGSFLSGPIVDRFHFKKTCGYGDFVSSVVMLCAGFILMTGNHSISLLYASIFLVSLISAFQWVALNSYLASVLQEKNLIRANAWVSTSNSLATVFAPSIASLALLSLGLDKIFLIDGLTYIGSGLLIVFFLPTERKKTKQTKSSFLKDFKLGLVYIQQKPQLLNVIMAFFLFNFFAGLNTNLTTPLFLERYTATVAGFLLGGVAGGSVFSGLMQSFFPGVISRIRNIPFLMVGTLALNVPVGLVQSPIIVSLLFFGIGILISAMNTATNLMIKNEVENDFRGRVYATARGLSWLCVPAAQIFGGFTSDYLSESIFPHASRQEVISGLFTLANLAATLILVVYAIRSRKFRKIEAA